MRYYNTLTPGQRAHLAREAQALIAAEQERECKLPLKSGQ